MDYTSNNYITVQLYVSRTLDSKISVNYLQATSGGTTGAPRQLISTLNTGLNRGT